MSSQPPIETNWSFSKKIFFRFLFVYFIFYCFPFPVDAFQFLDPVAKPYYNFLDWLIISIGEKWFHLKAYVAFPTFDKVDDSFYGIVFIYFNLLVSLVVTIIWSLLDRARTNYEKLYRWLRLYLRYFLASFLFGYGFVKVFPSQFQEITASRLTMTVGDQSPMLLAWNFMGYSTTLMRINGIVEVIAGLLLLFRRTTTLGAILSACTFGFIVIMDFSFNVPVRLLASHLLLMSIFLIIGDSKRLLNIFILNRPVDALTPEPLITRPLWRKVFSGLLLFLSICLLYSAITKGLEAERTFGRRAPKPPLYGVYNTIYFIRNHDTISPLETDSLRWKQLVIDGGSWNQTGTIKFNNEKRTTYTIEADTLKRMLSIQPLTDTTEKFIFYYHQPDNSHLLMNGVWKKDSVSIFMNKYDLNEFPLHKEKFRWISE